jgi:hypothetical protein
LSQRPAGSKNRTALLPNRVAWLWDFAENAYISFFLQFEKTLRHAFFRLKSALQENRGRSKHELTSKKLGSSFFCRKTAFQAKTQTDRKSDIFCFQCVSKAKQQGTTKSAN